MSHRVDRKNNLLVPVFCSVLYLLLSACATTSGVEDLKKAETHYKLGVSYLTKKELHEASVEFQKALKLNPKDKRSLNALGYISARFKEYDEAISYYKRAISIDPNYSEAMNNLALTYLELENWDEAIKFYKMALENLVYATPEKAYFGMGYAYYRKGEYLNAENALKKAVVRYPNFPRPLYYLGLVYMKLGKTKSAIEEFKKAVDIYPEYIDAQWELANAYLRTGDREKAIKHFKIVAESGSSDKRSKEALEYIELLKE